MDIDLTTKIFYPNKVSQTSGGKYRSFKDLNVIKNAGNGYARITYAVLHC